MVVPSAPGLKFFQDWSSDGVTRTRACYASIVTFGDTFPPGESWESETGALLGSCFLVLVIGSSVITDVRGYGQLCL